MFIHFNQIVSPDSFYPWVPAELLTSWHVVLQHDVQHECPPHLQQAYRPDVCEVAQTDVDGILPKKMVKFALFLDAALARLLFQAHSRESNQVTHLAQYARMHIHILQLSLCACTHRHFKIDPSVGQ